MGPTILVRDFAAFLRDVRMMWRPLEAESLALIILFFVNYNFGHP